MRYIGSKSKLLEELSSVVNHKTPAGNVFCDIFAGTGIVGQHFKKKFRVISNDALYFSYILQKATVELNEIPDFAVLQKKIKSDPFIYFANLDESKFPFSSRPFIFENYSPSDGCSRRFFTMQNALKIDAIRQSIETWKNEALISDKEYYFLLASLISSIPYVANIAGTFGAYLKHWDRRALKPLSLVKVSIKANNEENVCYNKDANELIKTIDGDVLYLDPPYNERQYFSNYHILETVAKYDNPPIKGITGTRAEVTRGNNLLSSGFCKKDKVFGCLSNLIEDANFKFIVLSYSNHGILSEEEIVSIFEKFGNKSTLEVQRIPYRQYKRITGTPTKELHELIFSIEK